MQGIRTVAVVGAGQMGGGIAQVAAASGLKVLMYDAAPGALGRCQDNHRKRMAREVEKARMTQAEMDAALGRIHYVDALEMLRGADIVIEAIIEEIGRAHV